MNSQERSELLWQFDLESEKSALDFWRQVGGDLSLLEDLLLVEIEKGGWGARSIESAVVALQSVETERSVTVSFLVNVYEGLVDSRIKPHVQMFHRLVSQSELRQIRYPDDPLYLGECLKRRFRIQRRIGAGAFGVVFLAVDEQDGGSVAIKSPRKRGKEYLNRDTGFLAAEAIAAEQINYDGCPRRYELVLDNGHPYLVMQFIDGSSLRDLIDEGPIEPKEAARIMTHVFDTLSRSHEKKVVHRDVKPENILLDRNGEVFLTDFGLVLFENDEQLEREGEVGGTLGYVPPDAILGATHELDGRADIWSAGMVLYEALTGKRLYVVTEREDALVAAVLAAKALPDFAADDGIPDELQQICVKCLQPNPLHRYPKASEVAEALTVYSSGRSVSPSSRLRIFIWRVGVLFGKHIRSQSYTGSANSTHEPQLLAAHAFGMQEILADINKYVVATVATLEQLAEHDNLLDRLPEYPTVIGGEVRSSLYAGVDEVSVMNERIEALERWGEEVFSLLQSAFELQGIEPLAIYEFGVLASQARGPFGRHKNLDTVAEKTGLPTEIWQNFCKRMEDMVYLDNELAEMLFNKLNKAVERHYLFGSEDECSQLG